MVGNRVLDLNAGLGGRVYAFRNVGFDIVGAIDPDQENCEIMASWLGADKVMQIHLSEIEEGVVPDADLIMGSYISPVISRGGKKLDNRNMNLSIFNIISKKNPFAFLLEVSVSSIVNRRYNLDKYLQLYVDLGYKLSYKVYEEGDFSGLPIVGKRGYIVGEKNISERTFDFPQPMFYESMESVALEDSQDIPAWYRIVRVDTAEWEESCWYSKVGREVHRTKTFQMGFMRENYLVDEIGPRKFTHNEHADFKGLNNWNYNQCKNKKRMYEKIAKASNVYVMKAIAAELLIFMQGPEVQKDSKSIAKSKNQKNIKISVKKNDKSKKQQPKNIFPKCVLKEMHIEKLKGLNNLSLEFNKNLVALMGVNGSGKSTVLHALACTYSPYEKGESYTFSYFFTPNPDATWKDSCFTVVNYDETEKKETTKKYYKKKNRWANYASRPIRDVYYVGVASCIPQIEIEKTTSFINYTSNSEKDKLAEKIISDASFILNKDYAELLSHSVRKKKYIGVQTEKGMAYSALSMGAGEQRVIKLLQIVYNAHQYSLILIDEIDLLLHTDAFRKLIMRLSEIAENKHLQIIFTTHSTEMQELMNYADIRYLEHKGDSVLVYDSMKPDLLYELSGERIRPYSIYVEDSFAAAIVQQIAYDLRMQRHVSIIRYGSIDNAFTVAAGKVIDGSDDSVLIVTDGDKFVSDSEKRDRLNAKLTGTEVDHDEKIQKALSMITQFNLPEDTEPERYICSMLKELQTDDECVTCAKKITGVRNSHDWISVIVDDIGRGEVTYNHIMELVSTHQNWGGYIYNVKEWLDQKKKEIEA